MPRNGLFADDGKVLDFALWVRENLTLIGTKATNALAAAASEAETRAAAIAAEVANRNTAIASAVNSAVNAEAALREADDNVLDDRLDALELTKNQRCAARMQAAGVTGQFNQSEVPLSTNGDQNIQMALTFAQGGISWNTQNGGGLQVAESGTYLVCVNLVVNSDNTHWAGLTVGHWRNGFRLGTLAGCSAEKDTMHPLSTSGQALQQLQAGDVLNLAGSATTSAGVTPIMDGSGTYGSGVSIFRVM